MSDVSISNVECYIKLNCLVLELYHWWIDLTWLGPIISVNIGYYSVQDHQSSVKVNCCPFGVVWLLETLQPLVYWEIREFWIQDLFLIRYNSSSVQHLFLNNHQCIAMKTLDTFTESFDVAHLLRPEVYPTLPSNLSSSKKQWQQRVF